MTRYLRSRHPKGSSSRNARCTTSRCGAGAAVTTRGRPAASNRSCRSDGSCSTSITPTRSPLRPSRTKSRRLTVQLAALHAEGARIEHERERLTDLSIQLEAVADTLREVDVDALWQEATVSERRIRRGPRGCGHHPPGSSTGPGERSAAAQRHSG